MHKLTAVFPIFIFLAVMMFTTTGCSLIFQNGRRTDIQKIATLQDENQRLANEKSELQRAKDELENRLRNEINDGKVNVGMSGDRLVVTFVSEVLFDSGKAELRSEALDALGRVAGVLNTTVKDLNIGIEGHTDNVPITHSKWKSNWELSTARALSVLHYMAEEQGLEPSRLAATGFGEYHPVADNSTSQGRQKNRRVEIVIIPKTVKETGRISDQENLK